MKKADVFAYFEKQGVTQKGMAELLRISQPAISKWPEIIPELQAIRLERLTDGALVYDETLYRKTAA